MNTKIFRLGIFCVDSSRQIRRVKRKITEVLELPGEIVLDVPKMTFTGNYDLSIENYKSIIEYSDDLIRLNTGSQNIKIVGQRLMIKTISSEEITISGRFTVLEFNN